MVKLSWAKDRNRKLKNRATIEEIHEQQQLSAQPRRMTRSRPSKALLRATGIELVQQHAKRFGVESMVTCDSCGHQGDAKIELSVASTKALKCLGCGHRQWLSPESLTRPRD